MTPRAAPDLRQHAPRCSVGTDHARVPGLISNSGRRPVPPAALLAALQAARGTTRGLFWEPPPEFHEALCAYVGALRAAGLGPVQVRLTVARTVPDVSPILVERSVARCADAFDRSGRTPVALGVAAGHATPSGIAGW